MIAHLQLQLQLAYGNTLQRRKALPRWGSNKDDKRRGERKTIAIQEIKIKKIRKEQQEIPT